MASVKRERPSGLLLRGGATYVVAAMAPLLAQAIITPLLTAGLSPEQYGRVAVAIVTAQIGQILLSVGLPASLARHVVMEESGPGGAMGQVQVLARALFVLAALAAVALSIAWSQELISDAACAATLGGISACPLAVYLSVQAVYQGASRAVTFARNALFFSVIPPCVGLLSKWLLGASPWTYLEGLIVGQLCVATAVVAAARRRFSPMFALADLRRTIGIGLPTIPHQAANLSLPASLVALASLWWGSAAGGELQIAWLIGSLPILLVGAVNNAWAVRVFSVPCLERLAYIQHTAVWVAVVASFLSIGASLLAPVAVHWLAGNGMDARAMVLAAEAACMACPVMVLYLANVHQIFASGRTWGLAISSPLSATLAIVGSLVLRDVLPDVGIATLSSALLTFYCFQAVFAGIQCKILRLGLAKLGWPFVVAAATIVACASVIAVDPSVQARVILACALGAVGVGLLSTGQRRETY